MHILLDALIPRFVTEDVALAGNEQQGYRIVCCVDDIEPDERFDGIATIKCFNLFGFGLFPQQVGEVRSWINPHDA